MDYNIKQAVKFDGTPWHAMPEDALKHRAVYSEYILGKEITSNAKLTPDQILSDAVSETIIMNSSSVEKIETTSDKNAVITNRTRLLRLLQTLFRLPHRSNILFLILGLIIRKRF